MHEVVDLFCSIPNVRDELKPSNKVEKENPTLHFQYFQKKKEPSHNKSDTKKQPNLIPQSFRKILMGDWVRGVTQEVLANSGSQNPFCIIQRIHIVLQILHLTHKLIHCNCVENSSLLNCRALSASVQQILGNSSISWQFLARSSPEKLCFSFLIRHIASSFPFESDQSIDLPDQVPSSGIGAACQFQKEQYQHFAFHILFCLIQPALQIILSEPQILLDKLDQLSSQGIHGRNFCEDRILSFYV